MCKHHSQEDRHPLLDDYGRDRTPARTVSIDCISYSHAVCGDLNCQCTCHDNMTDARQRWKCPGCKAWVFEKMAKVCEACHKEAIDEIKNPETLCMFFPGSNCWDEALPKRSACEACKPLRYKDEPKYKGEMNNLTPEEQELVWAASLNSYPHKDMKNKMIPSTEEAEKKKRRDWQKKGIQKAIIV